MKNIKTLLLIVACFFSFVILTGCDETTEETPKPVTTTVDVSKVKFESVEKEYTGESLAIQINAIPDGTVVEMVKSDTEKVLSDTTTFTELCFGTQNTSSKLAGKSIKLSLARYAYYLKNEKVSGDLLYRTEPGETLDGEIIPENSVLKSDAALTIDSFDKGTPVDLGGLESSIWYQK